MTYNHLALVLCAVFLATGIIIRYKIGKRRFNRRNFAGVEEFRSYRSAITNRLIEGLGMIIAILLICIGIAGIFIFSLRH